MADYRSDWEGMFKAYLPKYNIVKQTRIPDNAFVVGGMPNTVFLGTEKAKRPDVERTLQHEFAHQMEQKARQRYAPNDLASEMRAVANNWNMPPMPSFFMASLEQSMQGDKHLKTAKARNTYDLFTSNFTKPVVIERFNKLFGSLPENGRLANPQESPFDEMMADLNAYEMINKIDATQDPVLKKELFNNDNRLIEAYKAIAPNRADRLDAKDLAPYTSQYQEPTPWYVNPLRALGIK